MNRPPDVELVLRAYLADTGDRAPDRVLTDVAARIARQPRSVWRLRGRPFVNTYAKLAAAAAAVLIVAVVGYSVLPRNSAGPGSPTAAPSPTLAPTAAPTVAPTVASIQDVPDGGATLSAGKWRFTIEDGSSRIPVVATVPTGWLAYGQSGIENILATNSPPNGIAMVFWVPAHGLFSDACHWDVDGSHSGEQEGDVAVGPDVAAFVGALRANRSYASSTPTPVTFGASTGQRLELRFPADLDPDTCDRASDDDAGTFRVAPDTIHSQGKGNIWELTIVDVGGVRVAALLEYFSGTDPVILAQGRAIVDSFVFE